MRSARLVKVRTFLLDLITVAARHKPAFVCRAHDRSDPRACSVMPPRRYGGFAPARRVRDTTQAVHQVVQLAIFWKDLPDLARRQNSFGPARIEIIIHHNRVTLVDSRHAL